MVDTSGMGRRSFLATTGVVVATAGCLGGDEVETGRVTLGGEDPGRVDGVDNGAVVDVADGTMRVTAGDVQRSVFSPLRDNTVYEPPGGQFLVVQVESSGVEWDRPGGALELELDGSTLAHDPDIPSQVYLTEQRDEVALGVPATPATIAAVRFPHAERPSWRVPDSLVDTFDDSAEFVLQSAEIRQDSETVLHLTVENNGRRDGFFRCTTEPVDDGVPEPVRFTVNTGERTTATVRNDAVAGWDADDDFTHEIHSETRAFSVTL